ncbi:hypothetical protein ACFFIX_19610 [Metabacillus herbersteinensis]|uniref:Uncharacterized protein n=1 Tax=Metabacillus herbersteinensis TaxID=283816 RepID=A0ABV6GIT5_9BACI
MQQFKRIEQYEYYPPERSEIYIRFSILKANFEDLLVEQDIESYIKRSHSKRIEKILNYIANYTNITSPNKINQKHLINFLLHYIKNRRTLYKVIGELKGDIKLIEKYLLISSKGMYREIDFSVSNNYLWNKVEEKISH